MRLIKNKFCLQTLFGFLIFVLLLIFRTDGVHGDEAGYLGYARRSLLGDTIELGKPGLFYILNFFLFNKIGPWLGRFHTLTPHLFYAFTMSASVAFLTKSLVEKFKFVFSWQLFLLLLLSPMVIYHGTHLMMETPLIIGINFIFGLLLKTPEEEFDKMLFYRKLFFVFFIAASIVALKSTAVGAIIVLIVIAHFIWKRSVLFLASGALAGLGFHYLLKFIVKAGSYKFVNTDGLAEVFLRQFKLIPDYLKVTLFYCSPLAMLLALIYFNKNRIELALKKRLSLALLISFFGVLGIALVSGVPFDRYIYPTIWIAAILVLILAVSISKFGRVLILSSFFLIQASYMAPEPYKMKFWPSFATDQNYLTGVTTFVGVPIWQWILLKPKLTDSPCVFLDYTSGDFNYYIYRFLSGLIFNAQYFSENQVEAFRACTGVKLLVERKILTSDFTCKALCPNNSLRACAIHPFSYHPEKGQPGIMVSGACLYETDRPEIAP